MKQLKIYVIDRLCHRSTPENQFFFLQEQEPMTFTAILKAGRAVFSKNDKIRRGKTVFFLTV
jgi:hypothetical protein